MPRFVKIIFIFMMLPFVLSAQLKWKEVDADFGTLPKNVHVFFCNDSLDGKPFIAYYVEADLKDRSIDFTVDTTFKRRITPAQFFEKNNKPVVVVNTTFFSYETNSSLNLVMKKSRLVSYNLHTIAGRGKDTFTYRHPLASAIGIDKHRNADVAWLYTDSSKNKPFAIQYATDAVKDSIANYSYKQANANTSILSHGPAISTLKKWKMQTAVGGGPVLLQNGEIKVTNNEELKFAGKAIGDKHPRTLMGYTKNGKLIIMAIQGRFPGIAEGATLPQEAQLMKDIGCVEALNLDGGGSSCLLVNGKPTIQVSDKAGQRPVPAVFIIQEHHKN